MIRVIAVSILIIGAMPGCEHTPRIQLAGSPYETNTAAGNALRSEVEPPHNCELTGLVTIRNGIQLPSFQEGQPMTSGSVKSTMVFKEVKEQGRDGILVEENLEIAYLEPVGDILGRKYFGFFDRTIRSGESCQFSLVGTNIARNGPETNLTADYLVRKCVGTDYPCGETCEVRWDYQACRTQMCRATAITNLYGGQIVMRVFTRLEAAPPSSIAISATANFSSDVSMGEVANVLAGIGLDPKALLASSPFPSFPYDFLSNFLTVKVPQQAFIYKPTIVSVDWANSVPTEFQDQTTEAITIRRKQVIERTAACGWLTCQRSSNPEQCASQM